MAEAYEFKEKRKDGFWAKQKAVVRASTGSKSGIIGIKHAGMQKQNLKGQMRGFGKGAAVGGAAGATIGALMKGRGSSGKRALTAGLLAGGLGGLTGQQIGGYKADQKYLARKGVKVSRGGLKVELTPKARKKYLK